MPKIINYVGETFGLWKVLEKTDEKASSGAYLYKCINIKTGEIAYKHSGYLKQFKDRNSIKTTAGRRRKWIITKVAVNSKEA